MGQKQYMRITEENKIRTKVMSHSFFLALHNNFYRHLQEQRPMILPKLHNRVLFANSASTFCKMTRNYDTCLRTIDNIVHNFAMQTRALESATSHSPVCAHVSHKLL